MQITFPGGFSVLMSVYKNDSAALLHRAIKSVYENTLLPNQFVLILDGPLTTELYGLIDQITQIYHIEIIRLSTNSGLAIALNEGLKYVIFPWVVRADADDFNLPNRFEALAKAIVLHNDKPDLIGSAITEVDTFFNPISVRTPPCQYEDIMQFCKQRNPFNHMSVAFKRDVILDRGGYPDLYLKEDYGLWIKVLSGGSFAINLSESLVLANGGYEMYKRRGGFRYILSEMNLQRFLYTYKMKSIFGCIIDFLLRSTIFLLPTTIRGIIYRIFLRKRIENK